MSATTARGVRRRQEKFRARKKRARDPRLRALVVDLFIAGEARRYEGRVTIDGELRGRQ